MRSRTRGCRLPDRRSHAFCGAQLHRLRRAESRAGGPEWQWQNDVAAAIARRLTPTGGQIHRADWLHIVYFDQSLELDPTVTLRRALAPEGDSVIYQDRVIHVASWAARFLFMSEQLNQPVERLSGGERARVLIAQLMLQPADVLLLDEPTNDLDIPTLEILEESLLETSPFATSSRVVRMASSSPPLLDATSTPPGRSCGASSPTLRPCSKIASAEASGWAASSGSYTCQYSRLKHWTPATNFDLGILIRSQSRRPS